jgi:hypothetical protein
MVLGKFVLGRASGSASVQVIRGPVCRCSLGSSVGPWVQADEERKSKPLSSPSVVPLGFCPLIGTCVHVSPGGVSRKVKLPCQ